MHYGGVLMWHGAWRQAEEHLARTAADFAASRPIAAVESVARLGRARRRQGRFDEAVHPLEQARGLALAVVHVDLEVDVGQLVGPAEGVRAAPARPR